MAGRFAFGLENWTLPPEPKSGQGHCDCDEQGWSKANVHQLQVRLAVVLDVVVGASGAGQEAAEHEMARAMVDGARSGTCRPRHFCVG